MWYVRYRSVRENQRQKESWFVVRESPCEASTLCVQGVRGQAFWGSVGVGRARLAQLRDGDRLVGDLRVRERPGLHGTSKGQHSATDEHDT